MSVCYSIRFEIFHDITEFVFIFLAYESQMKKNKNENWFEIF